MIDRKFIGMTIDGPTLARVDALAERLAASRSYTARRLLAAALAELSGDIPKPGGGMTPRSPVGASIGGVMDPSAAPGAPAVSNDPGAPSFSKLVENTMEFQNRHNQRQRAARLREAAAKDEATAKAAAMTEAARREGAREADEIEQREVANGTA